MMTISNTATYLPATDVDPTADLDHDTTVYLVGDQFAGMAEVDGELVGRVLVGIRLNPALRTVGGTLGMPVVPD